MWCEPFNARPTRVFADRLPDSLLRQTIAPDALILVYPPKQFAGGQVRSLKPLIGESFDPFRHRRRSGVTGFALQILLALQ